MWNDEGFGYGMGFMGDSMWNWITGFHGILSLIFLALIIAGVVLLIRDLRRAEGEGPVGKNRAPTLSDGETDEQAGPSCGKGIGRHA